MELIGSILIGIGLTGIFGGVLIVGIVLSSKLPRR